MRTLRHSGLMSAAAAAGICFAFTVHLDAATIPTQGAGSAVASVDYSAALTVLVEPRERGPVRNSCRCFSPVASAHVLKSRA